MTKNIETLHKQTTEITDPELTKTHRPCTISERQS